MMNSGLVDHIFMGLKCFSVQHHAVHDRNAMLKNLRGALLSCIRRHTKKRRIDIPRLTDVGGHRNGSQRLRELSPRTDSPPHDGGQTEVVALGNEFGADLPDPAESDDGKTQRFHE